MTKLKWDGVGERFYETGVNQGVLYEPDTDGKYSNGVAWNGLTTVTESPSGAEASPLYADNIKYVNLVSTEEFGATLEAYTWPKEFNKYDGVGSPSAGIYVGQQSRKPFGLSYRTLIGNDLEGTDYGYKLHFVYNALAKPTEKAYGSVNDSPEGISFSWELTTTPVDVPGMKPSALITLVSTELDPAKLQELEDIIYGTAGTEPRLPMPDEIFALFAGTITEVMPVKPTQVGNVVTIPSATGLVYKINGEVVSGSVTLTEDVMVVAEPAAGYVFPNVSDKDWFFDFT